jgi:hypothetical protein
MPAPRPMPEDSVDRTMTPVGSESRNMPMQAENRGTWWTIKGVGSH